LFPLVEEKIEYTYFILASYSMFYGVEWPSNALPETQPLYYLQKLIHEQCSKPDTLVAPLDHVGDSYSSIVLDQLSEILNRREPRVESIFGLKSGASSLPLTSAPY
jgi:hypothetical protein